jgi:hypothetical protein
MRKYLTIILGLTLTAPLCAAAGELKELKVYPEKIELTTAEDFQAVVVQAIYGDGATLDVSADVKVSWSASGIARADKSLKVSPLKNGQTRLIVQFREVKQSVAVNVANIKKNRQVSFQLDVMPVLTKAGCNQGSCHGAAAGKDGFRLSLFGYDPDGDYQRITRELAGRRINLAVPEDSLLIDKALGQVRHSGGRRFDKKSPSYETLIQWLRAGVPKDKKSVPTLTDVKLYPPAMVLAGRNQQQQVVVTARYSDGTSRDVTRTAVFLSNNEHCAKISSEGVVRAGARGEAFVMARYGTITVGSQIIVRPKNSVASKWVDDDSHYIDRLVNAKLRKLHIQPSGLCDDRSFVRRVFIDIIGKLPTIAELQTFLKSTAKDKRKKLIDELLGRKEFVDLWVLKWAELLQIRTQRRVSPKAMLSYYNWLKKRIADNVPMDQMVQEILSAQGGNFTSPASNYFQIERDTLKLSENVAQVFMGMRIQCAQCHNHPFDRWTQNDYYGFAAFFSQIGRKRGQDPRETIIFNRGRGEVRHPVSKKTVKPKFLGGRVPNVRGKDRRVVLGQWLASKDNPYFAKNLANMVWTHFLGRGIIDPVDDVRVSNPSVNPQLLMELGKRFTAYKYDFKSLVRDICRSRAYQRGLANKDNGFDTSNFSHTSIRRIKAEVLLDCIGQVTNTKEKFRRLPLGARAVEIADGSFSTYFLQIFGRPKRTTVCSCEVKMEPTLSQALHLINGSTVTRNILKGQFVRGRLLKGKKAMEVVNEIYLRCLSRPVTGSERQAFELMLGQAKNRRMALEDVFWAVLNSREFMFNH